MSPAAPIRTRLAHTTSALGHTRRPSTWRAAFHLRPTKHAFDPAIRVGIATATVLVIGGLLGEPELAALAGLGAVCGAFARYEPYGRRAGKVAIAGLMVLAAVALGGLLGSAPAATQIAVLSLAAGIAVAALASLKILGPGAVIVVFAGSAATAIDSLPQALLATALGVLAGLLAAVAPVTRVDKAEKAPWVRDGLARLFSPEMRWAGARVLLASALAGWVALGLGLHHPLWAAMAATAAMQSVTFHSTMERGIQRLLGNISGAVLAIALLALGLGYWPTVVVIVALQMCTEVYVAKNYALASTTVTPMALLMMGIAGGITPEMAVSRVADTAIGVLLGVVVAIVTISLADRQHLPQAAG